MESKTSSTDISNSLLEDIVSKLEKLNENHDENTNLELVSNGFRYLIQEITYSHNIQFSTFFSQVAFAANTYKISGVDLYLSHILRKYIQSHEIPANLSMTQTGIYVLYRWCRSIDPSVQSDVLDQIKRPHIPTDRSTATEFHALVRFIALQVDTKNQVLLGYTEEDPHIFRKVAYNLPDRNELFTENVLEMEQHMQLPVGLNLINAIVGEDNALKPEGIVIDPDFLIDVTAVSECFSNGEINTLGYITRKMMRVNSSLPLLLGNIANMFLDELVYNPSTTFKEVAPKIFTISPIPLSRMKNDKIAELLDKAKEHFKNLKYVVNHQFQQVNIQREKCYLEPTFYSVKYGLQGRLDLYRSDESEQRYDIVELKSGRPFKPNAYGINQNHYIQTILYDLIVRHVLPPKVKPNNYILYSSQSEKALRFAPALRSQQMDAIKVRNSIRILEELLSRVDATDGQSLFDLLNPDDVDPSWRFVKRDLTKIMSIISQLDDIELAYFKRFVGLIAREHHIAKIGSTSGDGRGGFASLWCHTLTQKAQHYSSLLYLEISEIKQTRDTPHIVLNRAATQKTLSKFRKGDIAVLYPHVADAKQPLSSQVFKCTIIQIDQESVTIRLRNMQQNFEVFNRYEQWHLDGDLIDSSFNGMYRSIFEFLDSDDRVKQLLLGITKPGSGAQTELAGDYDITDNQRNVVKEAIAAEDYYLIWGPPGTGKTSKVLNAIVNESFYHKRQKILIVSFTNRAVDEICGALFEDTHLREKSLRIGSRYSASPDYVDDLLASHLSGINSRAQLRGLFDQKDIVISTVSSMMGKREIFDLVSFDLVIVDEASQLLEPMLVGLLPKVPKWILIGDHQQLPAVVTQDPTQSAVPEGLLNDQIKLFNTRNSLFERLMTVHQAHGWHLTMGILSEQGRMHTDIMSYVNRHFYHNALEVIPSIDRLVSQTSHKLLDDMPGRVCFVHCPSEEDFTRRQNEAQAKAIVNIVSDYQSHIETHLLPSDEITIGVIAPFRAQIALINQHLHDAEISIPITVDTVERYQGGAKDIIIYASTINHPSQFRQIVSLSSDGVDRKLNVAITRAREQFILLGDEKVMNKNALYGQLVTDAERVELT